MSDPTSARAIIPDPPSVGCDCIRLINEAFARENLNTEVVTSLVFSMVSGKTAIRISIPTRKRDSRSKEKPRVVIADYCPLCGKRYLPVDAAEGLP